MLESYVSPFLNRGSDHLRFPVFTLSERRLEHVCVGYGSKNAVYQDVSLPSWKFVAPGKKKGEVEKKHGSGVCFLGKLLTTIITFTHENLQITEVFP